MSSPLTSPLAGSSRQFGTPVPPSANLRNRYDNSVPSQLTDEASLTASFPGSAYIVANRLNEAPRSTFRTVFAASTNISGRKLAVRSDPSLLTCFDPLDKELYDLWAPKK
ncbi:hypothetical protein BDZ94DRAFT_1308005 [Collybia nuda]|uniref:Uncharacterized protein n=1 Tax=Collybia nuda TaxID=64659 RepID=A0A9P5YB72_9AGAR|nr:hypothetical protein BDZ94DRAFT_1308005 [Collybia nuda]